MSEIKTLNDTVKRTGIAYATLFNNYGEKYFLGNVQTMKPSKGRLHMVWKLGKQDHTSPYTAYMIHDDKKVLYTEEILPLRADMGLKKFDVELDL